MNTSPVSVSVPTFGKTNLLTRSVMALLLIAGLATAAACGGGSRKQGGPPPGWVFLGERRVDFGADRDVLPVTGAQGEFKRVMLRIKENGVEVLDLKIHFANGGTQDVAIRRFIPKGDATRAIDLKGGKRTIRKVDMIYRTGGKLKRGRALVRLFGLRA
ncbi:MAG: hypothetical protein ACYTFT_04210 [Planctomycetota bacterium]|jgi:hypothetical protein